MLTPFVQAVLGLILECGVITGPPDIVPRYFGFVWSVLVIHTWGIRFLKFLSMQLNWWIPSPLLICLTYRWLLGIVCICWVISYFWLRIPLRVGPPLCSCCWYSEFIGFQFPPPGPSYGPTVISRYLKSKCWYRSSWGVGSCLCWVGLIILLPVLCFLVSLWDVLQWLNQFFLFSLEP